MLDQARIEMSPSTRETADHCGSIHLFNFHCTMSSAAWSTSPALQKSRGTVDPGVVRSLSSIAPILSCTLLTSSLSERGDDTAMSDCRTYTYTIKPCFSIPGQLHPPALRDDVRYVAPHSALCVFHRILCSLFLSSGSDDHIRTRQAHRCSSI